MGIIFQNISFHYNSKRAEVTLDDVSFTLPANQFITILGAPGSGKSTVLQHMNGLLRADSGDIHLLDMHITAPKGKLPPQLRQRVGLVFQYPEQQLFRETVLDDLLFGPLNFFEQRSEAEEAVASAVAAMGIEEQLLSQNPFHLSSGQMRKVAIAATIASKPDVIVLDEPTASLDPASRLELLQLLKKQSVNHQRTVIIVTHNLEEVFPFTDHFLVLDTGKVAFSGSPSELLQHEEVLQKAGLQLPSGYSLLSKLQQLFPVTPYIADQAAYISPEQLADAIRAALTAQQPEHTSSEKKGMDAYEQ